MEYTLHNWQSLDKQMTPAQIQYRSARFDLQLRMIKVWQ